MNTTYRIRFLITLLPAVLLLAAGRKDMPFSSSELEAHLRYLASDELMGRDTGTAGNDSAAAYIARHFERYGLQKAPGLDTWFQPVPLERVAPDKEGRVVVADDTLLFSREVILRNGTAGEIVSEFVFAGHGWVDTTAGIDDYAGLDVRGKIVVVAYGTPAKQNAYSGMMAGRMKRSFARAHGAAALVELYEGRFPWRNLYRWMAGERLRLRQDDSGQPSDMIHLLIDNSEGKVKKRLESLDEAKMAISTSGQNLSPVSSNNVIGYLPGSDARRADEFIVLSAHYDHVGVKSSHGDASADTIYNGARDNGIGTVALLAAAKALAADPPPRPVLFIAFTAEEKGLLGSRYFVEQSPVALHNLRYVLNNDGAGYTDTSEISLIGLGRTTADSAIINGCRSAGLAVGDDPTPDKSLFNRSDNVNFARKGIPAVTFSPGVKAFDAEIMKYYHKPSDEVTDDFDFDYLLRYARAYVKSARLIAAMPGTPFWTAGDPYEKAGEELYGQ